MPVNAEAEAVFRRAPASTGARRIPWSSRARVERRDVAQQWPAYEVCTCEVDFPAQRPLGRALDDEDFDVRFNAVWGIAAATGQYQLRPGWADFREDEARHIREWKARLASLGVEVP